VNVDWRGWSNSRPFTSPFAPSSPAIADIRSGVSKEFGPIEALSCLCFRYRITTVQLFGMTDKDPKTCGVSSSNMSKGEDKVGDMYRGGVLKVDVDYCKILYNGEGEYNCRLINKV
jgi:hypothetical protein